MAMKILEGMAERGDFTASGAIPAGSVVKVNGDMVVAVQDNGETVSSGYAPYGASDGAKVTVAFGPGGMLSTDNLAQGVAAGTQVAWDGSAKNFKAAGGSDVKLGLVIGLSGGVAKIKSYI